MAPNDPRRIEAARWIHAHRIDGRPLSDPRSASRRANELLHLVDAYCREAKEWLPSGPEVDSLAKVMTEVHRHQDRMGRATSEAYDRDEPSGWNGFTT